MPHESFFQGPAAEGDPGRGSRPVQMRLASRTRERIADLQRWTEQGSPTEVVAGAVGFAHYVAEIQVRKGAKVTATYPDGRSETLTIVGTSLLEHLVRPSWWRRLIRVLDPLS